MPDFLQLVRRDHDDLEAGLRELSRPMLAAGELRTALDGIRLGLTAHAEAEDIVLYARSHNTTPAVVHQLSPRRARSSRAGVGAGEPVCAMPETSPGARARITCSSWSAVTRSTNSTS